MRDITRECYTMEKLTEAQLKELEEAEKAEIVYDDDSPRLSEAMKKAFEVAAVNRNRIKNSKLG